LGRRGIPGIPHESWSWGAGNRFGSSRETELRPIFRVSGTSIWDAACLQASDRLGPPQTNNNDGVKIYTLFLCRESNPTNRHRTSFCSWRFLRNLKKAVRTGQVENLNPSSPGKIPLSEKHPAENWLRARHLIYSLEKTTTRPQTEQMSPGTHPDQNQTELTPRTSTQKKMGELV